MRGFCDILAGVKKNLTIIIPARNEELTILETLKSLLRYVKTPNNIIVVNDHSTDKTKAKVQEFAKNHPQAKLVDTTKTKGFASAIKLGVEEANTDFILPVMADLCDDPKTIDQMMKEVYKGFDIVAGSRYMRGGRKQGGPKLQGFLSWLVCYSLHIITRVPTTDLSNSFKIYRRSILKNLDFDKRLGVEVSMYLTLQAFFRGAKITEVPTIWKGREEGKSKFKILERFPRYFRIYTWAISKTFQ